MKRYMLFIYDTYYPGGGMDDFVDSFDTVEDVMKHLQEKLDQGKADDYDNIFIFDMSTMTQIRVDVSKNKETGTSELAFAGEWQKPWV